MDEKSSTKLRKSKYEDFDQTVILWFKRQRQNDVPILEPVVKLKAEKFSEKLDIKDGLYSLNNVTISTMIIPTILQRMDQSANKSPKDYYRRKLLTDLTKSDSKISTNMFDAQNFISKLFWEEITTRQHYFCNAELCNEV
ncbi:hypothetical protein FQA39_LY06710 [Lamprigera yunnana]|nr:hypothetical protein FQA39_LY06710 [Lamprigera yunnana]